jgi:hypothetical protein
MLTLAIWWVGTFLEALLLMRGLQTKLIRVFPIFFSYLLIVFVSEILRFFTYHWYASSAYRDVYWSTQFLSLVVGSAVIFEVYRVGLKRFPGTARMTQYLLLVVFGLVFAKALVRTSGGLYDWFVGTLVDLERNLRVVQAVALLALLSLFLIYAIPFGRNLRGILIGYGMFIAMTVTQFTLHHYFANDVVAFWSYLQPICYLFVLSVWLAAVWSPDGAVEETPVSEPEHDYQILASSTGQQLERTFARLTWTARP